MLTGMMDDGNAHVLTFMTFHRAHRTNTDKTNPLGHLNVEIERRTRVVGIFPNKATISRLVGAPLLEWNDE